MADAVATEKASALAAALQRALERTDDEKMRRWLIALLTDVRDAEEERADEDMKNVRS